MQEFLNISEQLQYHRPAILYNPVEGRPVKATFAHRKDEVVDRFLGLLGKELHADRPLLGVQRRLIVLVGEMLISRVIVAPAVSYAILLYLR